MTDEKPPSSRNVAPGAIPPGMTCARCGRSGGVEKLGMVSGAVWLHCEPCGHLWRHVDPETDAFSLILTSRSADAQSIDEMPAPETVPRASRFDVQLEMRYRTAVDRQWRPGHTRNVSRSGVLFSADAPIPAQTDVELVLVLSGTVAGEPPSQLRCAGQIVRSTDDTPHCVAAAVGEYQLAFS